MAFVASHPLNADDQPITLDVEQYSSANILFFTITDCLDDNGKIILEESEAEKLCEYLNSYLRKEAY